MRLQVGGRSARHQARFAELARDDVVRARRADAHRQVEPFLHEIHDALRKRHVEPYSGVRGEKCGDRRCHMAHAEVHRSRELDRATRHHRGAACLLLGLVEVGEELHRALVERPAAFSEAYASGRAVQQARLEMRLQLRDVARRRRRGEPELLGGT
jgi:hypothetical protein